MQPASVMPPLLVSTHDARRLEALLARVAESPAASLLEQELLRAQLVEPQRMPPDVVTMNSKVVCVDDAHGVEHHVQLVYPQDADAAQGKVSVLAPVGSALLGLRVGSSIRWPLPQGRSTLVQVKAVTFQPEAHGQLD